MAENSSSTPSGTPPEDSRPRPQYGELAPEGWSWTPTPDERTLATPPAAGPAAAPERAVRPAGTAPAWDRPVTLSLLVLGLLSTFFAVSMLTMITESIQLLHTQLDLAAYEPDPSAAGLVTAGIIGVSLVWLATAAGVILLLVRGKRAFFVPLIGAVLSAFVFIAFTTAVLATDPTLLNDPNLMDVYGTL
ncbi:DUF6264 family protein [Cryobacterium sp. TMT2-42-4]|uniref:DUF6264 family protein n=1 Tax=Cryobacterium sp. TMT2-42-4 TaxID=1259255 RepID=UPI00106C8378|nr:DUF6264 family protein [Cryobacterium sp. TMT2-42-4]TFC33553.1 hypothetical protein E3O18_13745 [Cryobacterium sp. TMT2-42-4]